MVRKSNLLIAGLVIATLLTACGGKEEKEEQDNASVSTTGAVAALKEVAAQAEEMQKNGPVETVDFRQLKDLLPADADGLSRKEATGEKTGAMGFNVSTARGEYTNGDGSERIEVDIVDAGGTGALMGLAAWSMIDIDKETANGYERTAKMGNYKTYEKYDNDGKNGEINILVNKRFVVTAKGNGVSMDKIKATLEDIDLAKLETIK